MMKLVNLSVVGVAILSILMTSCSSMRGGGSDFKIRTYEEVKLSNGLPVLFIEDHSLPYLSLVMLVKTGSAADPKGKKGLANMVASLLNKGTTKRSSLQMADDLETLGASLGASASQDYSMLVGKSLSTHQDQLIESFAEVLTLPAFKKQEMNRFKKQVYSSLQKTVDNPSTLASVAFDEYIFGPDHPYSHRISGDKASIKSIKRKDVIRFFLGNYRPNNAYLAVVGDFKTAELKAQLETKLASWKPRKIKERVAPKFPDIKGISLLAIDKSDLQQTEIRLGHQGIKRTNPDFLSLRVANTILGGTFASRLMDEIRKKRGLTYGIRSSFGAQNFEGAFSVSTFSRHEKVGEAVKETLNVLSKFKKEGVSKQEVSDIKALLRGRFPQALETPERLAQNLLVLRYYGIPDTYLTNYLSDLDDVSVADVNKAIKKYLSPEDMKILVFTAKKKTLPQLKGLGKLETKSYKKFL